jgi:hypothetical protein
MRGHEHLRDGFPGVFRTPDQVLRGLNEVFVV